jgi:hypothetical protein
MPRAGNARGFFSPPRLRTRFSRHLRYSIVSFHTIQRRVALQSSCPQLHSSSPSFAAQFPDAAKSPCKRRGKHEESRDIKKTCKTKTPAGCRSLQGILLPRPHRPSSGGIYTQVMNFHSGPGDNTNDEPITESFSGTRDQPVESSIPRFLSTTQILSYGSFFEYDTGTTPSI